MRYRGFHLPPLLPPKDGDIIARRGIFRRILDAAASLFERGPEQVPEPPSRPVERPRPEPEFVLVPPEQSGIPPGPFEALTPYEKVLHNEGFVDYEIWDMTGETMVTDDYAAQLIYQGWFDLDSTPDSRKAAREDYWDYTGQEPRDFDWQTWRDWYESNAASAA